MFLPFNFPVHSFFIDQTHFSTNSLCALNLNVAQFFFFFPKGVCVYVINLSLNPHCEGGKRADIGVGVSCSVNS